MFWIEKIENKIAHARGPFELGIATFYRTESAGLYIVTCVCILLYKITVKRRKLSSELGEKMRIC